MDSHHCLCIISYKLFLIMNNHVQYRPRANNVQKYSPLQQKKESLYIFLKKILSKSSIVLIFINTVPH